MSAGWITSPTLQEFQRTETSACRVRNHPDFWIEKWENDFLINLRHFTDPQNILAELLQWAGNNALPLRRVYVKHLVRQPGEKDVPRLLHGDSALPPSLIVTENGMRFEVDFEAGYSTGLFMDQRNNRQILVSLKPKQLLNCFAYTCAFSVAAAKAGAATLSIDLSKRALERGKKNFHLNQLDPSVHRFIADDVLKVLPRLIKQGKRFDAIILDPPTFSRSPQTGVFQVEKDFQKLLHLALGCSDTSASILLSTNCTRIFRSDLEDLASSLCRQENFSFSFEQAPATPDIPTTTASTTTWLKIKKTSP